MPRIRYNTEVRTDILRRIHDGELSHAQAAREVGCSLSTIQQWIHPRRHNTSPASRLVPDSSSPDTLVPRLSHDTQASFIPIRLTDTRSTTLELTMPTGMHMRLIGVAPDFVIEVLKTLS